MQGSLLNINVVYLPSLSLAITSQKIKKWLILTIQQTTLVISVFRLVAFGRIPFSQITMLARGQEMVRLTHRSLQFIRSQNNKKEGRSDITGKGKSLVLC